ncbi:hypothetical protein GCM10028805_27250 [Spirosoma harenae]
MENPFQSINNRLSNLEGLALEILLFLRNRTTEPISSGTDRRITTPKKIMEMTGWPRSTFYGKLKEMPEGVVIRGKSKRLLIDEEKFVAWAKTPIEP